MTHLPDGSAGPPEVSTPDLSDILIIGVNHKTAPVALREQLALSAEETDETLEFFLTTPDINESLILSTCNRVEALLVVSDRTGALSAIKEHIARAKGISEADINQAVYTYSGEEAVRHIFRVAASLDSMVLGEPQILGQIKTAYRAAVRKKSTGLILNRLLHKAFSTAKRVRSETGIGGHAVSISYAAVELAKKIFDSLDDKTVLLVGAGEMAELAVEHLIRSRSRGKLLVANRTFAVGAELAGRFNGEAIRLEEISSYLTVSDIIISSTGAPGLVITEGQVRPIMRLRRNRPLFFIDIAVPRDVDPGVNKIPNAYLYDIDDLEGVIHHNIEARSRESIKAERIIDEAVFRFTAWFENLSALPTIIALRRKFYDIAALEMEKNLSVLTSGSQADPEAIRKMIDAIINKILHEPTMFLKNPGSHRNKNLYLDIARKLFHLDSE
jgi:glutamyl-tRNA reductase